MSRGVSPVIGAIKTLTDVPAHAYDRISRRHDRALAENVKQANGSL